MVCFFFTRGAIIACILVLKVCLAEPMPPPAKAFDYWQCISSPVPHGQKNCVEIRKQPVRETGNYDNWKMPVFCDPTINASVSEQMLINDEKAASDLTDDYAPGYKLYPGVGFYKVHLENKTWFEAKQICADEGTNTNLAIPSTTAEYAAITDMWRTFLPNDSYGIFVGLSDFEKYGVFKTIFDQPLCTLQLVQWISGEPNKLYETEKCVTYGLNRITALADFTCETPLPFLCEKPLPGRISGSKT